MFLPDTRQCFHSVARRPTALFITHPPLLLYNKTNMFITTFIAKKSTMPAIHQVSNRAKSGGVVK